MGRKHWVETDFETICCFIHRGKSPQYIEVSDLPVINQKSIRWDGINNDFLKYINPIQKKYWPKDRYIRENDILINSTGTGTIGRACLVDKKTITIPKVVDSHVTILRCSALADPKFVFNYIKSRKVQDLILGLYTGSTNQVELSRDKIAAIQIHIPPIEEQKLIIEKLDALLPKVKSVKVKLERIPGIFKKFRQSVLSAACSGRLTEDWREGKEIPEWDEKKSGELFSFVTSGSRGWAKYYSDYGALFIRIGNLDHNTIYLDLEKKQRVSPPKGAEGTRTQVKPNDILISITADVGMIALVPDNIEEAYINQHIALARPQNHIFPKYLAWYLSSKSKGQLQFQEMQRGATKVGLGLDDIKNVTVLLPPLEEQHEIVLRVEKLFKLADSLEAKYKKAMAQVENIEQSILAKAFRGELVDPDPNDEPADLLLQRILKEKAKNNPPTKKRKKQ